MGCSRARRWLSIVAAMAGMLLAAQGAQAQARLREDEFEPSGRNRAFLHGLIGPAALIGVGLATGVDQHRTSPGEWGDGGKGLARRAGSNISWLIVGQSVNHGLAILGNRSTEYHQCGCNGLGRRVGHAFVETVTAVDPEGRRGFAYPRFGGALAGAFTPKLWRPGLTTGRAVANAGGTLLFSFLANATREALRWSW